MFVYDGQISMTDFLMDTEPRPVRIDKPIRLIELFGGIGAQASALENLSARGLLPHGYELYRYVEWDKYAVQSYNAMHGTNEVPRDINDVHGDDLGIVDTDKYFYIFFYSFPCTDLSVAGKGQGMEEGSGTRSSLLWQCKRLLEETKNLPQCCIMENVPQVHGTKNQEPWNKWLRFMESLGYRNYWQDMNAKDYANVPQSRNRTFCVSLLDNRTYTFPKPIPLQYRMRDFLEERVDGKYYITNDKAKILIDKLVKGGEILTDRQTDRQTVDLCFSRGESVEVAASILARYDGGIGKHHNERSGVFMIEQLNQMEDGTCRTIKAQYAQTSSANFERSGTFGASGELQIECVGNVKQIGKIGTHQTDEVFSTEGVSRCIKATDYKNPERIVNIRKNAIDEIECENKYNPEDWTWEIEGVRYLIRIRKLTPKECFRLMGFSDRQHDAAEQAGVSNSQRYKQAGNSIVVQCIERLVEQML